jgi:uncharacterized phage protein (TIGR02218 family)
MAFNILERSNYSGSPIKLYEFKVGSAVWRYCSDSREFVYGGNTYLPCAISDDGITQSGNSENDDLVITMPIATQLVALFVGTPPANEIWLTIRRAHRGEVEARVDGVATVASVKYVNSVKAEVICRMITASFNRTGLRLDWGRQCPHALYDRNCKVNKGLFANTVLISTVTGNTLTASGIGALASGWLTGGFFECQVITGVLERRPIESHTGNQIIILGTSDGIYVGSYITTYPGCNRSTAECVSKFANLDNYGGFPHLPGKSPFDGNPVF